MYTINEMLFQKFRGKLIDSNQDLTNIFFNIEANYAVNPDIGYLYNLFNLDKYEELYNDINKNLNFIYRELTLNSLKNIMNKEKLSIEKKIEFYLNNLLKSIFTNQSQIANSYSVTYSNIQFNYENQDFNVKLEQEVFKLVNETIFVETPLILEFKKFMDRREGKTPYHIESLLNVLDTDYSFTDIEQDKFITDFTAKSKEIIQGNIESSGDSFLFKTDRGNYDIINTSSGTKSIGLLQYLVTNKALKKGSVLYWEEPEVHLHPKWQLKMIELFIELMNAGVKIVESSINLDTSYKYTECGIEYINITDVINNVVHLMNIEVKKRIFSDTVTNLISTSGKKASNTTYLLATNFDITKTKDMQVFYLYCKSGKPIDRIIHEYLLRFRKLKFIECQVLKQILEQECA